MNPLKAELEKLDRLIDEASTHLRQLKKKRKRLAAVIEMDEPKP